uniref:Uncharacterized protein n=1 Tax=Magallana gigas TaxID=29159 RepID=K1QXG9_MAGGI
MNETPGQVCVWDLVYQLYTMLYWLSTYKQNMHSGRYKRTSSSTQHNALLTFENRGFQRAGDEYVTINSMYDAGNGDYDEPNNGH